VSIFAVLTQPWREAPRAIVMHDARVICQHSCNAQNHDLIQAAASLDLNSKAYPYITCTTCSGG